VSIVIPVYNGANYLRAAIDSALDQSYPNCEVIVVNDGSTDDGATRDIALSFGAAIRYLEKNNGGTATALNTGIRHARGDYISWLSHDDLYFAHKVERQIAFLDGRDNKDVVVYSDYEVLNMDTSDISQHLSDCLNQSRASTLRLLIKSQLHGCTFLIPRHSLIECEQFHQDLRTTHDYHMWFCLLRADYEFVHCSGVVVRARWHAAQVSRLEQAVCSEEHKALHLLAFDWFFHELTRFPLSELSDIVEFEGRACKTCASAFLRRMRRERPVIYAELLGYDASRHVKRRAMVGMKGLAKR
jgi:glycosyltransferase involved in cell wall biosynthesis